MTEIKSTTIPHNFRNRFLKNSGSSTVTNNENNSTSGGGQQFIPRNLWGQYFDDTQDIDGDLTSSGTIKGQQGVFGNQGVWSGGSVGIQGTLGVQGMSTLRNGLNIGHQNEYKIDVHGDATLHDIIGHQGDITTINGTQANYNIFAGEQGPIDSICGTQADYKNIFGQQGWIDNIFSENIETDYLTVRKAAHFFKLIIDEIKSTKGMVLITPANAKFDKVDAIEETINNEEVITKYRCYFRSKDPDTEKEITNDFEVNDLVICQTFNAATGVSYNVSNKYYWRKCIGYGTTTTDINNETVDVHYIELSNVEGEYDPAPAGYTFYNTPEAGDEVSLLGNTSDTNRQAAILISAYDVSWIDKETAGTPDNKRLHAPFIVSYYGINTFDLHSFRWSVISRSVNVFKGDLTVNDNGTWTPITDYVAQHASLGPQGPQGEIGPQGESGNDKYKMVDCGCYAYVDYDLDPNTNERRQTLKIYTNIKVMTTTVGPQGEQPPRYMSANELSSFTQEISSALPGLRAYVKMSKSTGTTPNYVWYPMSLSGGTGDGVFTMNSGASISLPYTTSNTNTIATNTKILIALIPGTVPSPSASGSEWDMKHYDTWEIQVPVKPEANFQIIQGQDASIKALVTGQEGMQGQISSLTIGQGNIELEVQGIQSGIEQRAGINLTTGKITSQADKFEWLDSNNNQILGMQSGYAQFNGTVRAQNFYHTIALTAGQETVNFTTCNTFVVEENSNATKWIGFAVDTTVNNKTFYEGKYYRVEDIDQTTWNDLSDVQGPYFDNWDWCTGYADDISIVNHSGTGTHPAPIIIIPRAQDMPGKAITIRNVYNLTAQDATIYQVDYYYVNFNGTYTTPPFYNGASIGSNQDGTFIEKGTSGNYLNLPYGKTFLLSSFGDGWVKIAEW